MSDMSQIQVIIVTYYGVLTLVSLTVSQKMASQNSTFTPTAQESLHVSLKQERSVHFQSFFFKGIYHPVTELSIYK